MKNKLTLLLTQYMMKRAMENPAAAMRDAKRTAIGAALLGFALFIGLIVLVFRFFGWLASTVPAVGFLFNVIGLAILLLIAWGVIKLVWRLLMLKRQTAQFQDMQNMFSEDIFNQHTQKASQKPDIIDVTAVTKREKK